MLLKTRTSTVQAIFLMLREELCDDDIPHRTHICQQVGEIWEDHINDLEVEMNVWVFPCFTLNLADSEQFSEVPWKNFSDLWFMEQ